MDHRLALPVTGTHLAGSTLGDALDDTPGALTLLVFLRHHG
jgi:hypothetical protein